MIFGKRVRQLREQRGLAQRGLADRLDVSTSYVNKVENGKLSAGDYPSAKFIHMLAGELKADEDELLLLADKVPKGIRKRIRERPEAFRKFAALNDAEMDRFLKQRSSRRRVRSSQISGGILPAFQ